MYGRMGLIAGMALAAMGVAVQDFAPKMETLPQTGEGTRKYKGRSVRSTPPPDVAYREKSSSLARILGKAKRRAV